MMVAPAPMAAPAVSNQGSPHHERIDGKTIDWTQRTSKGKPLAAAASPYTRVVGVAAAYMKKIRAAAAARARLSKHGTKAGGGGAGEIEIGAARMPYPARRLSSRTNKSVPVSSGSSHAQRAAAASSLIQIPSSTNPPHPFFESINTEASQNTVPIEIRPLLSRCELLSALLCCCFLATPSAGRSAVAERDLLVQCAAEERRRRRRSQDANSVVLSRDGPPPARATTTATVLIDSFFGGR
jgi:hypothetical protein